MIKKRTIKARRLRKNPTDAERILWMRLRNRQIGNLKFRRQYPCGPYYLDFYCPEKKIAIEIDGGQHYREKGIQRDRIRSNYLKNFGIKVLRYSNRDIILNIEGVLQDILNKLNNSSPFPSPQRGEGKKEIKPLLREERGKKEIKPLLREKKGTKE